MNVATFMPARFEVEESEGRVSIRAAGDWTAVGIADIDAEIRKLATRHDGRPLVFDVAGIARLDTAGAWLVSRLMREWQASGATAELVGGERGERRRLVEAVARHVPEREAVEPAASVLHQFLAALGRFVFNLRMDTLRSLNMIGASIRGSQMKAGRGGGLRVVSIIHHIDHMALRAVPVVALMSFLIGAIIAQQGAWSLRYFGAEYFTVDFAGILLLREVGVLLTAIMVAGRTGSAMTAEIGSMRMREEVDALRVIGLNPVGVLVAPRLIALMISLPVLTVVSDMASLVGAALMLDIYSGISPDAFLVKLRIAIDLSTVFAGLIKAPFMALIIGIMAAVEGMKVEGSAESLGQRVTAAVVKAIFFVIVVDGIFAVFYVQIDF